MSTSIHAMDRKNERRARGGGGEYLDELKNSINLPVHSRSHDIRRALSLQRYASYGQKDMLILCGAFITRAGPSTFYFHEVLRPVNIFGRMKVEMTMFLTINQITRDLPIREIR